MSLARSSEEKGRKSKTPELVVRVVYTQPTASFISGAKSSLVSLLLLLLLLLLPSLVAADTVTEPVKEFGRGVMCAMSLSEDGTEMLTGSQDGRVYLWDLSTGQVIQSFSGHSQSVLSLAFSPNGTQVLTSALGEQSATLWDVATGATLYTLSGHSNTVHSVAFSPDGALLLTGSADDSAKLWDAANGAEIRTFSGHSDAVYSVAFSPDGAQVLTGSADNLAKLWNLATGAEIHTFSGHMGSVNAVAFSPDGAQVLTGAGRGLIMGGKKAKLWDAATGLELQTFSGHTRSVDFVAFSPDGAQVLTGSADETARLWDATSSAQIQSFAHGAELCAVDFSTDGTQIFTAVLSGAVKLWNLSSGAIARTFDGHMSPIRSVAFSSDGSQILTGESEPGSLARLWDLSSAGELRSFVSTESIYSVAISPDGAQVLSGSLDDTVRLWDSATGTLIHEFLGHTNSVFSVSFSPDGNQVLSGSRDQTAKLWDAHSGLELRSFQNQSSVHCVAFSPDGTQLLTAGSAGATLWESATGVEIRRFGTKRTIISAAFSPDGAQLLFGLETGEARLREIASGLEIQNFFGHSDTVQSVAFSPDGAFVLTGSIDKTAKQWDASTAREIRCFSGHTGQVNAVACSPDGAQVLTASSDGIARLWDAAEAVVMPPIEINSIEELQQIGIDPNFPLDERYVLTQNIDATATASWNDGAGFDPIGDDENPFMGRLDGQGYAVSALLINRPGQDNVGLFSSLSTGSEVQNLTLESADIIGNTNVGGLAGLFYGFVIENCHADGTVLGDETVGGLVGYAYGEYIRASSASCLVESSGEIAGGLIGANRAYYSTVEACQSSGDVQGSDIVGGLIGSLDGGSISQCYATGRIEGLSYTGGLIGDADSGSIAQCYATGRVAGRSFSGGLVGANRASMINCYSSGSISGKRYVGGLIGFNGGAVSLCYSMGAVRGNFSVGGLIGFSNQTVNNSFWDIASSGQDSASSAEGLSTEAMLRLETFSEAGWDISELGEESSIWRIVEGVSYPFLRDSYQDASSFSLTLNAQEGAVQAMPVQGPYSPNAAVVLTAVPQTGYTFAGWSGQGLGLVHDLYQNPFTVMMTHSRDLSALFLPEATIEIDSLTELQKIGKEDNYPLHWDYLLTQDIDASASSLWNDGAGFEPIGNWIYDFGGSFDGAGHSISGLQINRPSSAPVGLFATVGCGGKIVNLNLEGVTVLGGNFAAPLVAHQMGVISNCSTSGSCAGDTCVGGLVARNCGILSQSHSTTAVNSTGYHGGGLVGYNSARVSGCYATGQVTGAAVNLGGLVGYNNGVLSCSYASGDVSLSFLTSDGLPMLWSKGYGIGGFLGKNFYEISNCYALGNVSSLSDLSPSKIYVAGLFGYGSTSGLNNCFAAGAITGDGNLGGLVAYGSQGSATSFWDLEASGVLTSTHGIGATTENMMTMSTFTDAGWDFDSVWNIEEGLSYPFLDVQSTPLLELWGDAEVHLECGSLWEEPGYEATDEFYGEITDQVVRGGDLVDAATCGTYLLTYNVSNPAGNPATELTRTVFVNDSSAPALSLLGDNEVTLECGAEYLDAGATAMDGCDGDISEEIGIDNPVESQTPGIYTLTYSVSDNAGNTATPLTRTVTVSDTSLPVITLNGSATQTVDCGTVYVDPGATALDTCDGDISDLITTGGNAVNTAIPATYNLTYDVTDNLGNNAATIVRTVTVENNCEGEATVLLYNLTHSYDGTPKSASVSTIPAGLTVVVTYNGASALPVEAGEYLVVATVEEANYSGSATGALVIVRSVQESMNVAATLGQELCLTVTEPGMAGDGDFSWTFTPVDGSLSPVPDEFNATFCVENAQESDAGSYTVTYNSTPSTLNTLTFAVTVERGVPFAGMSGIAAIGALLALGGAVGLRRKKD